VTPATHPDDRRLRKLARRLRLSEGMPIAKVKWRSSGDGRQFVLARETPTHRVGIDADNGFFL